MADAEPATKKRRSTLYGKMFARQTKRCYKKTDFVPKSGTTVSLLLPDGGPPTVILSMLDIKKILKPPTVGIEPTTTKLDLSS